MTPPPAPARTTTTTTTTTTTMFARNHYPSCLVTLPVLAARAIEWGDLSEARQLLREHTSGRCRGAFVDFEVKAIAAAVAHCNATYGTDFTLEMFIEA